MRVLKFLFRTIYYLFLSVAAFVAVILTVTALPIKDNLKIYVVLSGSMEPSLHTGGVVVSRPLSQYGVGDIISFKSSAKSKEITTHRIVAIDQKGTDINYQTKGDANNAPDPTTVSHNNVVGKSLFSLPYLGYLVEFTKSPRGFILFIVVPATVLIWEEIKSITSLLRKPTKPKTVLEELKEERSTRSYPAFVFVLVSLVLGTTFVSVAQSYFIDKEISVGNVFGVGGPTPTLISPLPTGSITPTPGVGAGAVVINEINWGASNGNGNDEWIELFNTTNSPIDLTNWVVDNLGGGGPTAPITIPSGVIPANGYFIISALNQAGSRINVSSDFVTTAISLNSAGEQLTLKNSSDFTIDIANDTGAWFAGSVSTPKKSMERIGFDGTLSSSWQTATTHTNMDGSTATDEFATPKSASGI